MYARGRDSGSQDAPSGMHGLRAFAARGASGGLFLYWATASRIEAPGAPVSGVAIGGCGCFVAEETDVVTVARGE